MIVIKENEASNYYANYCIESWKKIGLEVKIFDAITPKDLPKLNDIKWIKYSIQKKYKKLKINAEITETERACFYSHYFLWKKCANMNIPIMVIEHDSYLESPDNLWFDTNYDMIFYDKASMGSYVIMPWFAKMVIDYMKNIKIGFGPYALLYNCAKENGVLEKLVNTSHREYKAASNQVMSDTYGNTIEHFCNSNPELFNPEDFHKFIKI